MPRKRATPRRTAAPEGVPATTIAPKVRKPLKSRSTPKMTPARKAARGQPCLINVAGVCNHNPETTVLVHFRWLGECGTSYKPGDWQAAHGCSECNRWTDSPTPKERNYTYESDRNYYAARALARMRRLEWPE